MECILLMIVVAIIGILAAIAIPAYTDYTARAKITEAVGALASAKTSVSEYYTSMGVMPANAAAAGINETPVGSYVDGVAYEKTSATESTVTAKIKGVNATANTKTFKLTGTGSDNGVVWKCSTITLDQKYLPANCRST